MGTQTEQQTETEENELEESSEAAQPWYKRKAIIGLIVAGVALLVAVCAGVAITQNQPAPEQPAPAQSEPVEEAQEKALTLRVNAPGWEKGTSTPVIVHIQSSDKTVNFFTAIDANSDQVVHVATDKDFTISYVSPINSDGSIYITPEAQPITEDKTTVELTKVPADQVTQEQADAILNQLKDAVSKGDETLSGDTGKDIINNAATNIGNAPNVNKDQVKDTVEKVEETVADTTQPSTPTEPSTPEQATSDNTTSNSSNNTGTSNSGSNTAVSTPSAPAQPQKVWVVDYAQQWVPNNVYVVDQAAYTEQVDTGRADVVCSCGLHFSSDDEWEIHDKAQGYGKSHSYSVRPLYETVTHPEVGHYEDQGHYETVEAGGHWE